MEEKQRELRGLTSQEVQERKEKGLINTASTVKTKSVKRIFYDNICTVFNIINVILFIALLCVGSYKNLLFMLVIAANTIIGIVQELRSKKSVDTLTILTESKLCATARPCSSTRSSWCSTISSSSRAAIRCLPTAF